MRFLFFIAFTLFICLFATAQNNILIVPQPVSMQTQKGFFTLNKNTVFAARDAEDKKAADIFNIYLKTYYGFTLPIKDQACKYIIQLTTKKFVKAPERDAYQLHVTSNGVAIEGDTYA